ncbi:MAG: DUF1566 domain-containing protein, partial [Arcobacteraceae bacterium]|nr:DUF1566 domain-containing protein [Arcobacteraceae bacterium]
GDSSITSFTLTGNDGGKFVIDSNGTITTKDTLDYETNSSFNFSAYATNSTGNSASVDVNITINNIEEPPTLGTQMTLVSMNDTIDSGTYVNNIAVQTAGSQPVTDYIITSGNDKGYFDINSSGYVTVSATATFHYYEQNEYNLTVKAITSDGNATKSFDIIITKQSDVLYLRDVVYNNNQTAGTVSDDKLYIYFDQAINTGSLKSAPADDFNVSGVGVIGIDSTADYNNTFFHRYTISLVDLGGSPISVEFNTSNDRIAILAGEISTDGGNAPNTSSIGVDKLELILKTGQTICYDRNSVSTTIDCNNSNAVGDAVITAGVTRSYTRDSDAEIVTDNITGLMWKDDFAASSSSELKTFDDAQTYCSALTSGGYNDWRVPSRTELLTIVYMGRYNPSMDTDVFVYTSSNSYWTNTTSANLTTWAWYVSFSNGATSTNAQSSEQRIRCVRDGN